MTPEQQEILDKLKKVLDPPTYRMIAGVLIGLWTNVYGPAAAHAARLLLAWAAGQGMWMWLVIRDALGLVEAAEVAEAAAAATAPMWVAPTLGGTAAAGGVALGPPALLLGAGLMLPGSKLGHPEWDWQGWWRDPCEDRFGDLADEFADLSHDRGSFPTGADRRSTMDLLGKAAGVISDCDRFIKNCPNSKRAGAVHNMRKSAERARDEYLDWLVSH